jgi:ketosteroid isomerase-like protein
MPRENVELTSAVYPRPGTDICRLFRDEDSFARVRAAGSRFFTDDFESVFVFPGEIRTYAGLAGLRQAWLDWLEPWATYRIGIDELLDVGDRVVVLNRDHARRGDVDTEVELVGATILTFRNGKVARWEFYGDRAEALEAAGLAGDVHALPPEHAVSRAETSDGLSNDRS